MKVLPIHNMQGIRVFRNTWRRLAMACRPACVAAAFLAMAFAPACTKSETVADSGSGTEDQSEMPMTLSASAETMTGTKALIEPDDFQSAGNQIRVFDKLTIDGNSETDLYINGRIAEYGTAVYNEDGSVATGWNLRDDSGYRKYYWTRNGTHSFTAFTWAYNNGTKTLTLSDVMAWNGTSDSERDDPSGYKNGLTYNRELDALIVRDVTLNISNQFDLMYGHHTRNLDDPNEINPYRDVPLEMKHLFTAVQFNIVNLVSGDNPALKHMSLNQIYKNGSAIITWSSSDDSSVEYDISRGDPDPIWTSGEKELGYNTTLNVFSGEGTVGPDGCLLLWPHDADQLADVRVSFTLNGSSVIGSSGYLSLNTQDITRWDAGKKYIYTFYIQDNRISFTVEIVDWIYDDIVIEE